MEVKTTIELIDKERNFKIRITKEQAKEIYEQLKTFFEKEVVYIPYQRETNPYPWDGITWTNKPYDAITGSITCEIDDNISKIFLS